MHIRRLARRRGAYSPMMGVLIFIVVGFGALSVDVSLMTLANLQAQATADAAAHAALVGFNQNKSTAEAWTSANFVVNRNNVALGHADLDAVEIGEWTFDAAVPAFNFPLADVAQANAARARVSRNGTNAVNTLLGGLMGVTSFDVDGTAIAAQRQRAIMLALDLSCSMMDGNGASTTSPVALLREGTQLFFDYIAARPQSGDMIGISTYANAASVEPTSPLDYTECTPGTPNACEPPWLPLVPMADSRVQDRIDGICDTALEGRVCPATGAVKVEQDQIGTCTSPHHALLQAVEELITNSSDRYYRAILFMTDGLPNCNPGGAGAAANEARAVASYAATHGIVIYGVTVTNGFGSDPNFVNDVVTLSAEGGFNQQANSASALPVMFEEVARRLPTVFTD
jgi:Flp pilus assembly protein TadG